MAPKALPGSLLPESRPCLTRTVPDGAMQIIEPVLWAANRNPMPAFSKKFLLKPRCARRFLPDQDCHMIHDHISSCFGLLSFKGQGSFLNYTTSSRFRAESR